MATFTVTTLNDELNAGATIEELSSGEGLSLREAVELSNASAGADRIEFEAGLNGLIRLDADPDPVALYDGQLFIEGETTIDGAGRITITGDVLDNDITAPGTDITALADNGVPQLADNVRSFFVRADADTTLIGLTLTGGRARNENGHGGAIYSQSDLTLIDSYFIGNSTSGDNAKGGGLFSSTSIALINTTITNNSTVGEDSDGGAIAVDALDGEGTITITDSEVSNNLTTGRYASGGGIFSDGSLTIINSEIEGNRTTGYNSEGGGTASQGVQIVTDSRIADNFTTNTFSEGGGAFSADALTIADSTIAGNKTSGRSSEGGGVYSKGKLVVNSSSITGNTTTERNAEGGGAYAGFFKNEIIDSLISGNSTSGDFSSGGGFSSSGDLYLTNTTISANSTNGLRADGGGVRGGDIYLINSTISGNQTLGGDSDGGGAATRSTRLSTENSIVLGNRVLTGVGDELAQGNSPFSVGALTLRGQNIIGSGDGALSDSIRISDQSTGTSQYADPIAVFGLTDDAGGFVKGLVSDNGGPVQTIQLKADKDNPALDAAVSTNPDARGQPRIDLDFINNGGVADLGAFELQDQVLFGPTITSATALTVAEGQTAVTVVTSNTDQGGVSFAIIGDADAALFAIDSVTGGLSFNAAPDFEAPADAGASNIYNIEITATDSDGLTTMQSLAITVEDVNEAPVAAASTVAGDAGTVISGVLNAVDDDGDTLSFSVVDGPSNGTVSIGANGAFQFTPVADFNGTDSFTFRASDGVLSDLATAAITVNQVLDPPASTGPTAGDDTLNGTALNDTINALAGNDNVSGFAGDDLLIGGLGDDSLRGAAGDDRLRGNGGDDTIKGNGGKDIIQGGGGDDVIRSGGGADNVRAGGGADNVKGGGGSDLILGGGGADVLNGNGGNDTLRGNGGDDTLKGAGGADVFQFRASDRNDTILDFRQGQDKIEIQSGANSFEALRIEQDAGDVLIGFGAAGQVRVITDDVEAFDESDFIF